MGVLKPVAIAGSLIGVAILSFGAWQSRTIPVLTPQNMEKIGSVSPYFQSYNVEMIEVTGGKFWKPYASESVDSASAASDAAIPNGQDPNRYEYRPPVDLSNPRLRMLAAALGPAYMRVSGTWANATYLPDADEIIEDPPQGYKGVLTREQWKNAVDFSKSVDAKIVTSFAVSTGTRNEKGEWQTDQAQRFLDYTAELGGEIAAAEFINEPSMVDLTSAQPDYDAVAYGRDFDRFYGWLRSQSPDTKILGPGSVGEGGSLALLLPFMDINFMASEDMLAASKKTVDGFSYHHYGALSQRCRQSGIGSASFGAALSDSWLSSTENSAEYYKELRDKFAPDAPMWLTETAEAACGGNPWAASFADSFRYLDQMGRLAQSGVQVVMHNTLAASDYALLDENDFTPRPNYWSALLWHKLMGETVLQAGKASRGLKLYAHCQPGNAGGISVLAINHDRHRTHQLTHAMAAERYTLSAPVLDGQEVLLNGTKLSLVGDELPSLAGQQQPAGITSLVPVSITFLSFADADNPHCR